MKILDVEKHDVEELIHSLRHVVMLKDPEVKVYESSFISLERIATSHLSPPQNYILRNELLKVRELKWELEKHDVDLLDLNGFVRIRVEGFEEPIDLLPPVVEESIEANGSIHFIINDGMHRVYMALREWKIPRVVLVRGIPKSLPYYAYPVPGGWLNVEERDDLPVGYVKKWHRIKDAHSLYRNFNSAFINVGGPRKQT